MTLVMYVCSLWLRVVASDAKVATQQGSTVQSGSVSQSSLLLLELVVLFQVLPRASRGIVACKF
jgi:hypothetical protein